jgi:prepilin-type N-terminal cleavage/methylation domain-containing protein
MSRAAFTLIELLLCLALAVVLGAATTPGVMAARDTIRADGAVDFLAARLHEARMEALKRRLHVAVRFESHADGLWVATYADGDGNGVRTADIAAGIDKPVGPPERLEHRFADVSFAFAPGVPDVDGNPVAAGSDPIRVGTSRMLSFGPSGTSSTGTVYVLGRGRRQLALRVLGATGRVRGLRFDFVTAIWVPR